MNLSTMQRLAHDLIDRIGYSCTRIEIAGSIRREKAEPGDIEIVCIADSTTETLRDLFGEMVGVITLNHLDNALSALYQDGSWQLDSAANRNGARYKRLMHVETGVGCDLFITTPRQWGGIFTIRTGSRDFAHGLAQKALRRNMFIEGGGLLHNHSRTYSSDPIPKPLPCPQGELCSWIIETPEEIDFLNALGQPWLDPVQR
jgi:DNA polymerase/3'-5' exonuclease PolX